MLRYFPGTAAKMGGMENGNPEASQPPPLHLSEEHKAQALEGLLNVTRRLDQLSPQARWEVLQELDKTRVAAIRLGVEEPERTAF